MKLLGWMHRKFRQNSGDPQKDFAIGQTSLDDPQCHQKPNYGTKIFTQPPKDHYLRRSFTGKEEARVEEEELEYEEESSAAISELFHGFLAIGTLGTDQVMNELSTPKFSISIENITENETEVTENDLKLINDELEKVLGAEVKDDGCTYSSGRSSHVSAGRSSHGSSITLGGKQMEGPETNGNGTTVCPLQGYLFGSAIELSETAATTTTTSVAKKEHRTSLGELFQMSKTAEENPGTKCDREDRQTEKEAAKSAMHLMKKLLKKKMHHASSRSSTAAAGGPLDSASAEKKLHKILQMFHRKVHPENSTAIQKLTKTQKNETRKKVMRNGDRDSTGDQVLPEEEIMLYPKTSLSKNSIRRYKSQSNLPQFIVLNSSDSNGNREHWIKTDADYLVLEL